MKRMMPHVTYHCQIITEFKYVISEVSVLKLGCRYKQVYSKICDSQHLRDQGFAGYHYFPDIRILYVVCT
jgi:hypothetical protein